MLATLLESRPQPVRAPWRRRAGVALSVALHAALGALAITATGDAAPPVDEPRETVRLYHAPRRTEPAHPPSRATPARTSAGRLRVAPAPGPAPVPSIPGVTVPDVALPDAPLVGGGEFVGGGLVPVSGAGADGPGPALAGGGGAPLDADAVERVAAPLPGNRAPAYPAPLAQSGVEGRAVVRFVVDTLGRVEPGSVAVVEADHPLFADAARRAVPAMRFAPATRAGRPVRQLVQQPFEFALRR